MRDAPREVPFVVEGDTDVPFARKLIRAAGAIPGTPYPQRGKPELLKNIGGYANAARHQPWLVLVDLDEDEVCAGAARAKWEPRPLHMLMLRVVVRSVEAWALGDREATASFFRVRSGVIPEEPEKLSSPKVSLVNLARTSSRREIQRDMIPRAGAGRTQGPGYEARLIEFGERHWELGRARLACPSLDRAVGRLSQALRPY